MCVALVEPPGSPQHPPSRFSRLEKTYRAGRSPTDKKCWDRYHRGAGRLARDVGLTEILSLAFVRTSRYTTKPRGEKINHPETGVNDVLTIYQLPGHRHGSIGLAGTADSRTAEEWRLAASVSR